MAKVHKKTQLQKRTRRAFIKKCIPLYIFLIPGFTIVILFQYMPMFSNYIAFLDYDFNNGWFGMSSPFIGFKNFKFVKDASFWKMTGRTILYSMSTLLFSFPLSLILALQINEVRHTGFKKVVQTMTYIPHFVSWVTVAGLFYLFLSTDRSGLVNNIIEALGGKRYSYMQDAHYFLPFLIISKIWKEMGWGTIIYLASLSGIDTQIYESAMVDGAGRWQQCRYITLPSLVPTTSVLLIFELGKILNNNFDQIFNMQNTLIRAATDTLNIHTYYRGVVYQQYDYAAAIGLFQGVVSLILVLVTNWTTKRLSDTGIF